MSRLKSFVAAGVMTLSVAVSVFAVAPSTFADPPAVDASTPTAAATTDPTSGKCAKSFLTFPTWYRGLTKSATDCNLKSPTDFSSKKADGTLNNDGLSNYIWHIVLNVIDIVLQLVAYLAFFMILVGGFQFLTNGGTPAGVEAGRKTILNASIGFVISIAAVAIDNKVFDIFTGVSGTASLDGSSTSIVKASAATIVANSLDIVYYVAGAVSIIVIIVSGLLYITSAGNASNITRAKNTLTYAVVGLIVIVVAFAITTFVGNQFA